MQIARKILLPQSPGKVATFNQQWTYRMCTNKNKISLLFPLCTKNSEPGHFFFTQAGTLHHHFPPVAGSLICLIFFAPRIKVWHSSRSGCCKMGTGWWGWHPRLHWSCEKDPQVLGPAIQLYFMGPKNQHRQLYPWFLHEFSPLTGGRGCMVGNIYVHVYLYIQIITINND